MTDWVLFAVKYSDIQSFSPNRLCQDLVFIEHKEIKHRTTHENRGSSLLWNNFLYPAKFL